MNDEQPNPPLANYYEVRIDAKRRFELYPDSIRIVGTSLKGSFETTIPLKRIEPRVNRLRVRHRIAFICAKIGVWSILGWGILVLAVRLPLSAMAPFCALVMAITSALFFLATMRKVEFAEFVTDANVVAFDVARSGPDRANFDAFVNGVRQQIRMARGDE